MSRMLFYNLYIFIYLNFIVLETKKQPPRCGMIFVKHERAHSEKSPFHPTPSHPGGISLEAPLFFCFWLLCIYEIYFGDLSIRTERAASYIFMLHGILLCGCPINYLTNLLIDRLIYIFAVTDNVVTSPYT